MYINITNLEKSFLDREGRKIEVLDNLNFSIEKGEMVAIFGPNGCGKTTFLNILTGLTSYQGNITINGRPPIQAKVGYVFQDYRNSLFPWRNVMDNIAFPLEVGKVDRKTRESEVIRLLDILNLNLPLKAFPYTLSGGQQQMIAIARALITNPDLLILDEPFAALDYEHRLMMQKKLLHIWQQCKKTTICVSHDIEEAIYLADRLLLFSPRPATLRKIFTINLVRPRSVEIIDSSEMNQLKKLISREFLIREEIKND